MKIAELEPRVIEKGLKPKHLILAKGSSVKWLVCLRKVDEDLRQLVVYDAEGKAYASVENLEFKESFFESMNVTRSDYFNVLIVNYIICVYKKEYDIIRSI